jgi:hypothetical protein
VLTGVGAEALEIQALLDLVPENQRTVRMINQASRIVAGTALCNLPRN